MKARAIQPRIRRDSIGSGSARTAPRRPRLLLIYDSCAFRRRSQQLAQAPIGVAPGLLNVFGNALALRLRARDVVALVAVSSTRVATVVRPPVSVLPHTSPSSLPLHSLPSGPSREAAANDLAPASAP